MKTRRTITDGFVFSASGINVHWRGPGGRIQLLWGKGGLTGIDSHPDPIMTLAEARDAATEFITDVLRHRASTDSYRAGLGALDRR